MHVIARRSVVLACQLSLLSLGLSLGVVGTACSSAMKVQSQKYAKLRERWTFENDFPEVWAGIERALSKYKVVDRDPEEVNAVEMKKLAERRLSTDWIYSESRDKYVEFKVNNLPKKKYLQTRIKYEIRAARVLGGTDVVVETSEEIELLDKNGQATGWAGAEQVDTSRPNEMLEKIKLAILSAPNT
ncbi:MAG: hypothetical protein AB7F66_13585 [Bacteriovoracia bacterium]